MISIALLLGIAVAEADRDEQYAQLVTNVAASEDLFHNVEIVVDKSYEYVLGDPSRITDGITQTEHQTLRIVLQDGMRYRSLDQSSAYHSKDGLADVKVFHNQGFDNDRSRMVQTVATAGEVSSVANLHDTWFDDNGWIWPHTLLMSDCWIGSVRFSEYLMHSEKLHYNLRVEIDGAEDIQGLHCVRLLCETWDDGQVTPDRRFIWVATERNFLPVKTVLFAVGYSSEIPLSEEEILELREIAPGIWLPYEWKTTVWDELAAAAGKRKMSNVTSWKVKEVSLDPHYDVSFFRDIEIPPGTLVYELENGKIVRGARTPPVMDGAGTSQSRSWVLIANAALVSLVVIGWLVRRATLRRRLTQTP